MKTKKLSNKVEEVKQMTFPLAVESLLDGKRVTRLSWGDKRNYYLLKDGLLSVHKAGEAEDVTRMVILNDGDLAGFDWVEL